MHMLKIADNTDGYEPDNRLSLEAKEFWNDVIGVLKDSGYLRSLSELQAQASARESCEHIDESDQK